MHTPTTSRVKTVPVRYAGGINPRDRLRIGQSAPWWRMEVPRLATIPAALAAIAIVAAFNGAFAKTPKPAPAPVAQTATQASPAP